MTDLYLRKVILDVVPEKGISKRIEDLRIKFDCEKTNESSPNNAKIEIFNLSDTSRATLEAKNTRVRLQIGYLGIPKTVGAGITLTGLSGNVETVFVGSVVKCTHKYDAGSPDIVTTIEVADGGNRFRNAKLEKGYPPNAKLEQVVNDLIEQMGLNKGAVLGIPKKKYANGVTFYGLARDHLDTLAKTYGFEWSIQDETLQIIPANDTTAENGIQLDSESGLVGFPSKTAKGVEFTSLIQPRLRPGRKVILNSRILKGTFKIRKVKHSGDSHSGDFLSKCEATR